MLIPFNWLKEYVDIELPVGELAQKLTVAGIEVCEVTYSRAQIENVVVGEILKIKPHPNADNLLVCQVSDGRQIFSVVCGAKNIKNRDRVPLARVGATLPGGVKITRKKIREEVSSGMLCSEKELGLGQNGDGILILPKNAKLGENIDRILLSNPVLDIELTANRSDCASVYGIAREVAAILGKKVKGPETGTVDTGEETAALCGVEIKDSDRCRRYIARVIKNVNTGRSPEWVVKKIEEAGLRPVNNVVDVTNYVLMELGHPLHAFDYDKLSEHRIVVRRGTGTEKFRFLDGFEREAGPEDLVIADAAKPVALAGIMGGEAAGVTEATKNVLLESAYFNPDGIRKTSKKLNLSTEASYRFERGVDIENVLTAVNRAAHLIQQICGGEVAGGLVDVYPEQKGRFELELTACEVKRVLGHDIAVEDVKNILTSLGFLCSQEEGAQVMKVTVPSYRNDVKVPVDLVEEVARIYGYDRIASALPAINVQDSIYSKSQDVERRARETMLKLGFYETINFSLVGEDGLKHAGAEEPLEGGALKLRNPLIAEQSFLRTSLLPGLLSAVKRNSNYKLKDMMIFEAGRVFGTIMEGGVPAETAFLSGCLTGARREPGWEEPVSVDVSFHYLKGVMETLLGELGIKKYSLAPSKNRLLNAAACADMLVEGAVIGSFGEVLRSCDFMFPVFAFEVNLEEIAKAADFKVKYESINRFPAMKRDISFLAQKGLTYAKIYDKIIESGDTIVKHVQLFDMYSGKQVQEGYSGMAVRITYQSEHRTLIDQEVNDLHQKIVSVLEKEFKIVIRK